jgi:hypothetical protein
MAAPATYNFGKHVAGDTVKKKTITVTEGTGSPTPVDLTGSAIAMKLVLKKNSVSKAISTGITLSDPTNGEFEIDAFSLTVAGIWSYDIQITLADTTVNTWISGTIEILEDITP